MEYPESLEPKSEQRLFESLALSEEEKKELEFIRRMMKGILRHEQKLKENKDNTTEC